MGERIILFFKITFWLAFESHCQPYDIAINNIESLVISILKQQQKNCFMNENVKRVFIYNITHTQALIL